MASRRARRLDEVAGRGDVTKDRPRDRFTKRRTRCLMYLIAPGGTAMTVDARTFVNVLHADGPDAERAGKLELYGQFVGDWETDIITHAPDGALHRGHGEIHFGWV